MFVCVCILAALFILLLLGCNYSVIYLPVVFCTSEMVHCLFFFGMFEQVSLLSFLLEALVLQRMFSNGPAKSWGDMGEQWDMGRRFSWSSHVVKERLWALLISRNNSGPCTWGGEHNHPTSTQLRWFGMSWTAEWRKSGQQVLRIFGNSRKTVGKAFLMKLVERMLRVCKAVIKAKAGNFQ